MEQVAERVACYALQRRIAAVCARAPHTDTHTRTHTYSHTHTDTDRGTDTDTDRGTRHTHTDVRE